MHVIYAKNVNPKIYENENKKVEVRMCEERKGERFGHTNRFIPVIMIALKTGGWFKKAVADGS